MKAQRILAVLSWLIVPFALVAAGTGVLWQGGSRFEFTTLRGQTVEIWGSGLYRFDSVAGASQEIAQDVVTLILGVPLLVAATLLAARGSLRGKVLHAGALGYFLYTYTSMTMLTAYNVLYLVYVALFSMSLLAFVLALMAIDVSSLPAHFTDRFPRRSTASFMVFLGVMLALLWLGRIVLPSLLTGEPPFGLDNYSTIVIQSLDLGIVAPAAILAGVLLLRRAAFGYLLSSVVLVKGFAMGAALMAMVVGQMLAGVDIDPVGAVLFLIISVVDATLTVLVLRSISQAPVAQEAPLGADKPEGALTPVTR